MSLFLAALVAAAAGSRSAAAFDLKIVHWNDVHARDTPASVRGQQLCLEDPYNQDSCYGGHARIATMCKQTKAADPATLCIDAGDEFLGTAWDILFEGKQVSPVLKEIGTDVMTAGNHEFDYGVAHLAKFIDSLAFPMLGGCNMDTSAEPALNIKKWHVFDVAGRKVALLGYIAGDVGETSAAGAVEFSDPVTAVPQCIKDFKASPDAEGVSIIGLVSHAGVHVDMEVAAVADGASFIISSHSHTPMFPGKQGPCLDYADGACMDRDTSQYEYPLMVSGRPILQQYYASKYLGVATLTFSDSGELTAITADSVALGRSFDADGEESDVVADPKVEALLDEKFEEVADFSGSVIGALPQPGLLCNYPEIRMKENALGNAICDGIISTLKEDGFKEHPDTPLVCLTNSGTIHADIKPGDVTYGDVTTTLPFGNFIQVLEITGATLKEALSHGYNMAQNKAAKFAHIGGGLSVVLDYGPMWQPGPLTHVVSALYDCEDIPDDKLFHLATNSFIGGGGDGYQMFADLPRVLEFGSTSTADALADYIDISTPPGGTAPDEITQVEGRIVAVEDTANSICNLKCNDVACAQSKPTGKRRTSRAPRRPRPTDPSAIREAIRRGIFDLESTITQEE